MLCTNRRQIVISFVDGLLRCSLCHLRALQLLVYSYAAFLSLVHEDGVLTVSASNAGMSVAGLTAKTQEHHQFLRQQIDINPTTSLSLPRLKSQFVRFRPMLGLLVVVAAVVGASWYLLDYLYIPKHLPDEPPLLSSTVPYVGHILGLWRHGTRYYEATR